MVTKIVNKLRYFSKNLRLRGLLGKGTLVERNVAILSEGEMLLGPKCHFAEGAVLQAKGKLSIGRGVFVNRYSMIVALKGISIGDNVRIAERVSIRDHDHAFGKGSDWETYHCEEVTIENDCWIGCNSTILKGVHLGPRTVVGAGSVVTKSFPGNCVVAGCPAKLIKHFI